MGEGDPRRRQRARALPGRRDHRPRRPLRLARRVAADRPAHQAQRRRPASRSPTTTATAWRSSSPTSPATTSPSSISIHRGHARVEDRIRQAKDCGLANLPFQSFAHNQVWLWLVDARPRPRRLDPGAAASPTTRARGSSSGCATGCCTSPDGSPATPAARRCASRATGPGPASSPPPSRACKRSQRPPPDRAPRAAADDHPRPPRGVSLPANSARTPTRRRPRRPRSSARTPTAPTHHRQPAAVRALNATRSTAYCKRPDPDACCTIEQAAGRATTLPRSPSGASSPSPWPPAASAPSR